MNGNGKLKQVKAVRFTDAELKAIHRELYRCGWSGEVFYAERRTAMKKLDQFFGCDVQHLKLQTR